MVLGIIVGKLLDERNEKNGVRDKGRKYRDEQTRKLREKWNKNVCPECDTKVEKGWKHCPECGKEL